jgi:hypothetical protein
VEAGLRLIHSGRRACSNRRIPRELLARLLQSFDVVFAQDRGGFASPGAANPLGRMEITRAVTERELRALLLPSSASRQTDATPSSCVRWMLAPPPARAKGSVSFTYG